MIEVEQQNGIHELRLSRPPVNALDAALLRALNNAIDGAVNGGAEGIVISGGSGVFSAGLDLPELLKLDRDAIMSFWGNFTGLMRALAECPVPVATAITGHSPAGGAVIALCGDYRVMADGDFKIGLNEVSVGLALPAMLYTALVHVVGSRQAARLGGEGKLLQSHEALAVGFVDELAPPDRVVARARQWLEAVLCLPPRAYAQTRALDRAALVEAFAKAAVETSLEDVTDDWFSDETQASLSRVVAQLRNKKG
jgi:enoyl-CoA hydratase/carnithine racemase